MLEGVTEQQIADVPQESPHFVRAVTSMGDERDIVASKDIYASNGTKLLAKGARIDSKQFEKLTRYRLSAPLDQVISSEQAVDATSLALEADKLIEHDALHRQILTRGGDPRQLKHGLANLKLASTIELRLTVMSQQYPTMYVHTLQTAITAFAIAQRLRLPPSEHAAVLLAALGHDFGEMHTDPCILDQNHQITLEERRFVHVHPVTSALLLQEVKDMPPSVTRAVLQHHERLDGSGYPNALSGRRIDPLARLIAVADVTEAVLRRLEGQRIDMLFRLNKGRFDQDMVAAMRDLLQMQMSEEDDSPAAADAAARLNHLQELLHTWFKLRDVVNAQTAPQDLPNSPLGFLFDRMASIRSLVLQAGFDPDNITSMLSMVQGEPELLRELRAMLDELEWLQGDLANEIDRRSPELSGLSQGALQDLLAQLRAN
jgi:HD-GYP domain-containing protein (c-di-GMP phosphodiesterase class II)